jgi:hypothetical protein
VSDTDEEDRRSGTARVVLAAIAQDFGHRPQLGQPGDGHHPIGRASHPQVLVNDAACWAPLQTIWRRKANESAAGSTAA